MFRFLGQLKLESLNLIKINHAIALYRAKVVHGPPHFDEIVL